MNGLTMFTEVLGGLCIFLLGMKNMSEGMQAIAGNRLRRMIQIVTSNRLKACATGAMVTSVIQSSSVTSVMVIGMVSAGLMTLTQAIGVVLGADIGTTITAWIVSINVIDYGLLILGLSGFFFLFAKNERVQFTAMTFMGIGMVFFGLYLMKNGLHPLREQPEVLAWFSKFNPDSISGRVKCVLVGALVTAVVQSSSATVAITITLARNEL
ncbi:MAG: Na/Pi cotransporter family protein, partial [Planctomycetes bacterium]|nr:Na/Pi cotransporter family protein [Planctomycetota bacterium]